MVRRPFFRYLFLLAYRSARGMTKQPNRSVKKQKNKKEKKAGHSGTPCVFPRLLPSWVKAKCCVAIRRRGQQGRTREISRIDGTVSSRTPTNGAEKWFCPLICFVFRRYYEFVFRLRQFAVSVGFPCGSFVYSVWFPGSKSSFLFLFQTRSPPSVPSHSASCPS